MKRLALLLAMAGLFAAPTLQACPPLLSRQALQQLESQEELSYYVMLRWLTCGAETTLPALPVLREDLRAQALQDDSEDEQDTGAAPYDVFAELVVASLSLNPRAVVAEFFEEREDLNEDTPAHFRALLAWQVSAQQMAWHFEQGVAPAIAFLREQPLTPAIEQRLELILIAQEIRQGKIEQARTHFARVSADAVAIVPQTDTELAERLVQMKAILAPVREQSLAAATQRWVVDKSTGRPPRTRCGTGNFFGAMYSMDYLRDAILRRADADAAIAELLQGDWRNQIDGHGSRTEFLAELLRKRHQPAALKLAWDDALASIRNEDDKAGLDLFGHYLALPSAVLEGDVNAAGGARERQLTVDEMAELVRRSALYRETYAASR